MGQIIFSVPIMGKPRMTRADRWKKRPVVERYWRYKDELIRQAKDKNYKPGNTLDIEFCIPMPKSWSLKKKAEYAGEPHQNKPDLDNLLKGFLDCLMDEDKMVHTINARKTWMYEGRGLIIINR
tara:strand:- start:582 stop:953 length:372 start_codon:yes stop_codon:yes gene_type:complete